MLAQWRSVINALRCYQARVRVCVCGYKRLSQNDELRIQFQHRQRGALHSVDFHGGDKFALRKKRGRWEVTATLQVWLKPITALKCLEHRIITVWCRKKKKNRKAQQHRKFVPFLTELECALGQSCWLSFSFLRRVRRARCRFIFHALPNWQTGDERKCRLVVICRSSACSATGCQKNKSALICAEWCCAVLCWCSLTWGGGLKQWGRECIERQMM